MQILLFGRDGQLGWELHRCVNPLGQLLAIDKAELDLAETDKLRDLILDFRPDLILNAAAYTAVDRAEEEVELARAINGHAPGVMAECAKLLGAALIHYSTDYVFDGVKTDSYLESDLPKPINTYGQTKLEGEIAVKSGCDSYLILRTSWVYSMRASSFPTKVLGWAREQERLRIVDDQIGSPTWSRMLAETTALIIAGAYSQPYGFFRERRGVYHLAGLGAASRYEWALAVLENDPDPEGKIVKDVHRARSEEFETAANRPANSALDCTLVQNIFNIRIPAWEENLKLAMDAVG